MALDEAIRGKLGVCKRYGRDTEKYGEPHLIKHNRTKNGIVS